MNVSLILTTKNEAATIGSLLESAAGQTVVPDEIVIVDANSGDNTRDVIRKTAARLRLNVNLINKNSNRSQARNLAITRAASGLIAATDAGCILDKHWLERITAPLQSDTADSVAGYYLPVTPTCFEKSVAPFVSVMPQDLNFDTFLPSSRSVAFTKAAWEKVGGYPEKLNYCEDLVFATKLKDNTRMAVAPKATVFWLQSTDFPSFYHQIKNYARGDVEAGYAPHLKKIAGVYFRYLVMAVYPPLFFLYLIWPILKHYRHVRHPGCFLYLPSLQITADMAIIAGSLQGLLAAYRRFHTAPRSLFSSKHF